MTSKTVNPSFTTKFCNQSLLKLVVLSKTHFQKWRNNATDILLQLEFDNRFLMVAGLTTSFPGPFPWLGGGTGARENTLALGTRLQDWVESNSVCYYTLNSLTLFWLAESVQWIFEISARDVTTADYTIIMSRTLKVTGYYVMYDRSAWFPKGNHVEL